MKKTNCGVCALLSSIALLLSCNQDSTPFGPQDQTEFQSTMTGKVTDRNGKPLAGALVTALPVGVTTVSGPDGSFTLSGLASGKYRIALAKDDYRDTVWSDSVRLGMTVTRSVGAMGMLYRYATVSGVVEDSLGSAQPMAGIAVENQTSTALAVDGRFVLGRVEPGRVRLFSAVAGLGYATIDTVLQADETLEGVKMRINRRGGAVTGKVVDADKNPIVGASVKAVGGVLKTVTAKDGSFRISEIPGEGNVVVEITSGELSTMITGVRVGEGSQTRLDTIRIAAKMPSKGEVTVRAGLAMAMTTDSVLTLVADTASGDSAFRVLRYLWSLDNGANWDTTAVNALVVSLARLGWKEGLHNVLVKVVAIDGRVSQTGTLTVRLLPPPDWTFPVVKRVQPSGDTTRLWKDSLYVVAWDVTDNRLDVVEIAGERATSGTSRYELKVALPVGPTIIRIMARDVAGNTTWDSVRVSRREFDNVKPSIVRVAPSKDTTIAYKDTSLQVTWKVSDAGGLDSVWLDGVGMKLDTTGKVSKKVTLAPGSMALVRIRARDLSGLVSKDSLRLARAAADTSADTAWGIPWNEAVKTYGVLYDARDSQQYRTVVIGSQTWMAENLNYAGQGTLGVCYNGSPDSCSKYGRLYKWSEVMNGALSSTSSPSNVQGICPDNWHVPSDAEWKSLEVAVGMMDSVASTTGWRGTTEGTKLKSSSGWSNSGNGTDVYGFRVLPAGYMDGGAYGVAGEMAFFWSASEYDTSNAWGRYFKGVASVYRHYEDHGVKRSGFSLRCVKGAAAIDTSTALTSLSVDSGSLTPSFNAATLSYSVTIPSTLTSLKVNATASSMRAVITYNGLSSNVIALKGDTIVQVKVLNGASPRYYTIRLIRKARAPQDTTLSLLDVSKGALSPAFVRTIRSYRDTVESTVDTLKVSAWATDSVSSKVFVNGVQTNVRYIALNAPGMSTSIRVLVRSKVDNDSLEYTVNVWRMPKSAVDSTWGIPWQTGITYGVLYDARDSQEYRTVKIGSQTWMAENLNYKGSGTDTVGLCFNNSTDSCSKYGRLYTWAEVMDTSSAYNNSLLNEVLPHQGVCPGGWHVSSNAEWDTLMTAVGGNDLAGTKLKSTSGWCNSANGADAYGFRALPASFYSVSSGIFSSTGYGGHWWSATEASAFYAWMRSMEGSNGKAFSDGSKSSTRFSLRCVQNSSDTSVNLSALLVDAGSIDGGFDSNKTILTDTVASTVMSLKLKVTASSPNAIIRINEAVVASGSDTLVDVSQDVAIGIEVSNPNTKSTKTYSLHVVHKAAPQDTTLANLKVSKGTLSPAFDPKKLTYKDTVASTVDSVMISAWAKDSVNTKVWINGVLANFRSIALNAAGSSTSIRVVARSTDNDALEYTVNVWRMPFDSSYGIPWNSSISYGSLAYAGQSYKTVTIGTQKWMAENLNVAAKDSSWHYYPGNVDSAKKYGRLYTWAAAMNLPDSCNRVTCASLVQPVHQGVCPSGWHVPSDSEWTVMQKVVDASNTTDGTMLKSTSGWDTNTGTDTRGFRALAGGNVNGVSSSLVGSYGYWWSATEGNAANAWLRELYYRIDNVNRYDYKKTYGFSVRCLEGFAVFDTSTALASLSTDSGVFGSVFKSAVSAYNDSISTTLSSITVRAKSSSSRATITINGSSDSVVTLATPGDSVITVVVSNYGRSRAYKIRLVRREEVVVKANYATLASFDRPYRVHLSVDSAVDTTGLRIHYTTDSTTPNSTSFPLTNEYGINFARPVRLIAAPWRNGVKVGPDQVFDWRMDSCFFSFDQPDSNAVWETDVTKLWYKTKQNVFEYTGGTATATWNSIPSTLSTGSSIHASYIIDGSNYPNFGMGHMVPWSPNDSLTGSGVMADMRRLKAIGVKFKLTPAAGSSDIKKYVRIGIDVDSAKAGPDLFSLNHSGVKFGWDVPVSTTAETVKTVKLFLATADYPGWATSTPTESLAFQLSIMNSIVIDIGCGKETCVDQQGTFEVDDIVYYYK